MFLWPWARSYNMLRMYISKRLNTSVQFWWDLGRKRDDYCQGKLVVWIRIRSFVRVVFAALWVSHWHAGPDSIVNEEPAACHTEAEGCFLFDNLGWEEAADSYLIILSFDCFLFPAEVKLKQETLGSVYIWWTSTSAGIRLSSRTGMLKLKINRHDLLYVSNIPDSLWVVYFWTDGWMKMATVLLFWRDEWSVQAP